MLPTVKAYTNKVPITKKKKKIEDVRRVKHSITEEQAISWGNIPMAYSW